MFLSDDNVLEPKIVITIKKKSYTMLGTFKVLKVIQQAFDTEIIELSGKLLTMQFTDMAKLMRIAIYPDSLSVTANEEDAEIDQKRLSLESIEEWLVEEGGIDDTRCLLFDFMRTSVVPRKKRKEAHRVAVKLLSGLLKVQATLAEQATDSLGESTESFA